MNEARRVRAHLTMFRFFLVCLFCTKTREAIMSRPDESELSVYETTTGQMMA